MNRLFIILLALISLVSFSIAAWLTVRSSLRDEPPAAAARAPEVPAARADAARADSPRTDSPRTDSPRTDSQSTDSPRAGTARTGGTEAHAPGPRDTASPDASPATPDSAPRGAMPARGAMAVSEAPTGDATRPVPPAAARQPAAAPTREPAAADAAPPVPPARQSPAPTAPARAAEERTGAPPPAAADGPLRLALPVSCLLNGQCFIQHHVDVDPGPGQRDFRCGALTYDGHKGVDFALRSLARMQRGMDVLATADGVVRAIRDGEPDIDVEARGRDKVRGKECGNAVVLVHPGGYETQYCHLKRGSVQVRPTQPVRRGQRLGEIGLSGKTQFPHLHLSVRRNGETVDPFTGARQDGSCGGAGAEGLWSEDALAAMPYRPGGLVAVGLSAETPNLTAIRAGRLARQRLPAGAPVLFVWAEAFGVLEGDQIALRLSGPDGGELLVHRGDSIPRNRARQGQWTGRKRPAAGWAPGVYTGEVWLLRPDGRGGEDTIAYESARITVGN